MGSLDVSIIANNFGLQEKTSTSPNRRVRPLIRKTGWVSQKEKRDRWTETERKGREGAVFYEKGG